MVRVYPEDVELKRQAGAVVKPRRDEADEIADQLASVPDGHGHDHPQRVTAEIFVILRRERNAVLVQRKLLVMLGRSGFTSSRNGANSSGWAVSMAARP
jgi:hypothetical protein